MTLLTRLTGMKGISRMTSYQKMTKVTNDNWDDYAGLEITIGQALDTLSGQT